MSFIKSILIASCVLAISSPAEAQRGDRREREYLALTEEQFTESLSVIDDPLNPDIRINTRQGYRDYQFSFGPRDDQFLRAAIMRSSGRVVTQAYVTAEANTPTAIQPTSVSFEHTLDARPIDRVALDVRACSRRGCLYYEEMVFDLSLDEITALIEALTAQEQPFVRFRIHGQSGRQHDGRFHISELRAFRAALEPYAAQATPPSKH